MCDVTNPRAPAGSQTSPRVDPRGDALPVPAEHPRFEAIVARHVHAREAFVIVATDGSETLYTPMPSDSV